MGPAGRQANRPLTVIDIHAKTSIELRDTVNKHAPHVVKISIGTKQHLTKESFNEGSIVQQSATPKTMTAADAYTWESTCMAKTQQDTVQMGAGNSSVSNAKSSTPQSTSRK